MKTAINIKAFTDKEFHLFRLKQVAAFQLKMLKKLLLWARQGKKIAPLLPRSPTPLLPLLPYSLKRLFQQALFIIYETAKS